MAQTKMEDRSEYSIQKETFSERWRTSPGRFLLILDYDGTLTPIVPDPRDAILSRDQHAILESLASSSYVSVWIVSGRDKAFLSEQFRSNSIGLVAEHGAFRRYPGHERWSGATIQLDFSWVSGVQDVLKGACQIVPGSRIETKAAAVVWHWRANQDEGSLMAPAIQSLLQHRASSHGWKVKATSGKCIVEVRPESITKGGVVRNLLEQNTIDGDLPKHILCAGDDATDEDMFTALNQTMMPPGSLSTIRILGDDVVSRDSAAARSLASPTELWRIIEDLETAIKADDADQSHSDTRGSISQAVAAGTKHEHNVMS